MATATIEQEQPTETDGPFHIVCQEDAQSPNMWVGICVGEELKARIKDDKILNAQMILTVTREGGYGEKRYMAPLLNGIIHVTFTRPGSYKLRMQVGWTDGPLGHMKGLVLGTDDSGAYRNSIFDDYYDRGRAYLSEKLTHEKKSRTATLYLHHSERPVYIHANNFAKDPHPWVRAWVETFFKEKRRDECHFKRRMIKSALLTFLLPFHYLLKLIMMAFMVPLGFVYGNGFKHAWKPGRHGGFSKVFGDIAAHSVWLRQSKRKRYAKRHVGVIIAELAVLLGIIVYFSGISIADTATSHGTVTSLKWIGIFLGGGLIAVGAGWFFKDVLKIEDWLDNRRSVARRNRRKRKNERELSEIRTLDHKLDTMSCAKTAEPMTIEKLVKRRSKSPIVIYRNAKDKVCLPFAER